MPGVVKFRRTEDPQDPHWRSMGRKKEYRAEVAFTMKAMLQCRGVFSNDLRSSQELVVNAAFDWNKMQPQKASTAGAVVVCCCLNKGNVVLNTSYDKAAYQAGETMHVTANIQNDSTVAVRAMVSKLQRIIMLRDGSGHSHRIVDTMCTARFEGVPAKSAAVRDMPLQLMSATGFLPSINSPHLTISYTFSCVCDVPWAFDIVTDTPVLVYQPAPTVSTFAAAFGGQVPPAAVAFM